MQTQLLRFCKGTTKVSSLPLLKITTKSTNFLPAKTKISILWYERQTKKDLSYALHQLTLYTIDTDLYPVSSSEINFWHVRKE